MSLKNKKTPTKYLDEILSFGDYLATSNVSGYGAELCVFLGRGEYPNTFYVHWLFSSHTLEQVFKEDFRKTFYPVTLTGYDTEGHIIYRKLRKQFLKLN